MESHSLEAFYRVYNDDTGEFIEVRQDRDGLNLVEIVQGETSLTLTVEQAPLVVEALRRLVTHLQAQATPPRRHDDDET